jgi:glycine C-acetyltransferase
MTRMVLVPWAKPVPVRMRSRIVIDGVDVYFATFAKSMAGIGAFVAADEQIVHFLRYNMRSQTFAKALPMPMVLGLKNVSSCETHRNRSCAKNYGLYSSTLQKGLKERSFNLGVTNTMVTPVFLEGDLYEATSLTRDLRENLWHLLLYCNLPGYP